MNEPNAGIKPPLSDVPRASLQRLLRDNCEQIEHDLAIGLYGQHDVRMNRLEDVVLAMEFLLRQVDAKP